MEPLAALPADGGPSLLSVIAGPLISAIVFPLLASYGRRGYRRVAKCRRRNKRLDSINEQYERYRSVRIDAVYHHGWAKSRGDHSEAKSHEAHVMDIDKKLEVLKRQYQAVEADQLDEAEALAIDK